MEAFAHSLQDLYSSAQNLASDPSNFVVHRTQCCCLSRSYVLALLHVTQQLPQIFALCPLAQEKLVLILSEFLRCLHQGLLFMRRCLFQQAWVREALRLAFSTEAQDVHLEDLVLCLSVLRQAMDEVGSPAEEHIVSSLDAVWARASETEDLNILVDALQHNILVDNKASVMANFLLSKLLCQKDGASALGALPQCLWADPLDFTDPEIIAQGTSAVVYKVKWCGEMYAKKEFIGVNEDSFGKEAAIQAKLTHPNVLDLICCISERSTRKCSLVTGLMEMDLSELISKKQKMRIDPPLTLPGALDIMLQIAKGMEYLHRCQIIHRDLKTSNILLTTTEDGSMRVKLADFGMSKAKNQRSNYTSLQAGRTRWRAPEVLEVDQENEDHSQGSSNYPKTADVYSFAMVCYEVLTGKVPFDDSSKNKRIYERVMSGERPMLPSSCPPYLASYIERCWNGDPEKRPSFAQIARTFRHLKGILLRGADILAGLALSNRLCVFIEEMSEQTTGEDWVSEVLCKHSVRSIAIVSEMFQYKLMEGRMEADNLAVQNWLVPAADGLERSENGGHITTNLINGGGAAFKDSKHLAKSDAQCLILQENELPAKIVYMKPSSTLAASRIEPIENPNGIQLLLAIENAQLGETIFVGAVVQAIPLQFLEFYFFNAKDMAMCVGVGLAQAKVILHNDLSITIEGTTVSERELKDTWMPFLSDNSCHLAMQVRMDAPGIQVNGDDHAQAFLATKGGTLSRLYGVGFDCGWQYVDETYDAAEVSWPLLYDMALFILTSDDSQFSETNGKLSAQGSGSFQGNIRGDMGDKLRRKCDNVMKHGNLTGGGRDGNEDGFDCNQSVAEGDPPVVLKVAVYPLSKSDILDTQGKPFGLEGACIAPSLVFEFRRNGACKRISINTQTRLQLASQMDVCRNKNLFGWYHTDIEISFGCEDTVSRQPPGRVAVLKQGSCKILNPRTSYKYTTTKTVDVSSNADVYTAGGQAGLKFNTAWLGGIELQGSSSVSKVQQAAICNCENMEITAECLCGGFFFRDLSSTECPALARFSLSYPLDKVTIWHDREFVEGTGLLSTIEPHIEGTWIPLNGLGASPYLFRAERSLKCHTKIDGQRDHVLELKQEYVLPFYVNHAMSHLRSQRSEHIELLGDQRFVPNVHRVGIVY